MSASSSRAVVAGRAGRGAFAARGAATSGITTMLAAISHTVGGGEAPAPLIVVGMIVLLVLPSAVLLTARPPRAVIGLLRGRAGRDAESHPGLPGLARIIAATAFAQLAFHAAFSLLGAPGGMVPGAPHAHHAHGALVESAPFVHGGAEGPGMVASHVIAALVTIAILAYGETVIRRGAAWQRRSVRSFAPVRPLPTAPRVLAYVAPRIRPSAVWLPATGVRGPPVFS
ncbi:hypothetical protein [Microbacterium gubbeenense]|uniref:hypothetical protein n=1 Tax=Microbacterium gubbeenense TaxID=159896 RepID=UPI003F9546AE